jgi:leucyl aminopeptidase (aminopeptidase T)
MAGSYHQPLEKLFRDNLGLRRSERVLVFADIPSAADRVGRRRYRCAKEAAEVAGAMGREAVFVDFAATGAHGAEPPEILWRKCFGEEACARLKRRGLLGKLVSKKAGPRELTAAGRILRGAAETVPDVIVGLSFHSTSHTRFRSYACRGGARYGSMPLFDPRMFEGPMAVDWKEVARRTRKGAALLSRSRRIVASAPNGTYLRFDTGGRKASSDDGLLHRPGAFGNLPAGEVYMAPREGKTQGVLVAEWSPVSRLRKPLVFWLRDGLLHEVEGKGEHADLLRRKIRENPDNANVAELGIGTNPGARRPDNILESEKILGTIHVAFGDNHAFGGKVSTPFHQDYVVFGASLTAEARDGRRREMLREGEWVL